MRWRKITGAEEGLDAMARTVHAETGQMEIVRRGDRGWFLEPKNSSLPRQKVSFDDAISYVAWALKDNLANVQIHFGLPGGKQFDRRAWVIAHPSNL